MVDVNEWLQQNNAVAAPEGQSSAPASSDDAGNVFSEDGALIVRVGRGPEEQDVPLSDAAVDLMDPGFVGLDAAGMEPDPPPLPAFEPYAFAKGEIENTFREFKSSAPVVLAAQLATEMGNRAGGDVISYEGLRDGTAPYFDRNSETRDLSPEERRMSDREILNRFSNAKDRSFLQSLADQFPGAVGTIVGAGFGGQTGAKAARFVPPIPYVGPAARIVLPIAGTIGGAIYGKEAVKELEEELFGAPDPVNPFDRKKQKMAETAMAAIEGAGMVRLIGRGGINLTSAAIVDRAKELSEQVGPNLRRRGDETVAAFENLVGSVGKRAAEKPVSFAAGEGAMATAATLARGVQETNAPGSTAGQLVAEAGVPIVGALSIQGLAGRFALGALGDLNQYRKGLAQVSAEDAGRAKPNLRDSVTGILGAVRERRDMQAGKFLMEALKSRDIKPEDLDTLIKELGEGTKVPVYDPRFKGLGDVRRMLEALGKDFTEEGEEAKDAIKIGLLEMMRLSFADGTEEGYLFGSSLAKMIAEADISKGVVDGVNRVTSAYKQVKGSGGNTEELATALVDNFLKPYLEATRKTAKKLYDRVPEHSILFDLDSPPTLVGALERVRYPVGDAAKGLDPLLQRVADNIRRREDELRNMTPVNPSQGDYGDMGEMSFEELNGLQSQLGDLARSRTASPGDRRLASELKQELKDQMNDLSARRDISDEKSAEIVSALSVASSYVAARSKIFRGGVWKGMVKKTDVGDEDWETALIDALASNSSKGGVKIKLLQQAARFAEDPINTPVPNAPDLQKFKTKITADLVYPEYPPPSTSAAFGDALDAAVASSKGVGGGDPRTVVLPDGQVMEMPTSTTDAAELLRRLATPKGQAVDPANPRPLDLVPELKRGLEEIAEAEAALNQRSPDSKMFNLNLQGILQRSEGELKRAEAQNLWWTLSGEEVGDGFINIVTKGLEGGKTRDLKSVYDSLLTPIRRIQEKAAQDPVGLVQGLKESNYFPRLFDDITQEFGDDLSPEQAAQAAGRLVEASREGLKAMMFDILKNKSLPANAGGSQQVDWAKFSQLLNDPPTRGSQKLTKMPSIADWMVRNRLASPEEMKTLKVSLKALSDLEAEVLGKDVSEKLLGKDRLKSAMAGIFGAGIGSKMSNLMSKIPGMGNTGNIAIPGIVANVSRGVLIDAKAAALQDRLFSLLQNPRDAARILQGLRAEASGKGAGDATLNYFKDKFGDILITPPRRAAAYSTSPGSEETEMDPARPVLPPVPRSVEEENPALVKPQASLYGQRFSRKANQPVAQVAQAPQPKPFLELIAQAAQAPANAPRPAGQSNPEMRQRMAAAFPEDRDLMSGGIASMMG
jgi:hypothetical protein